MNSSIFLNTFSCKAFLYFISSCILEFLVKAELINKLDLFFKFVEKVLPLLVLVDKTCDLFKLTIFIGFGFSPNVPGFTFFLSASLPKFLNLKGMVSSTDLGKYFKL